MNKQYTRSKFKKTSTNYVKDCHFALIDTHNEVNRDREIKKADNFMFTEEKAKKEGESIFNQVRLTLENTVQLLSDQFEMLYSIGHGSFGQVVAARNLLTEQRVALKIISQQSLSVSKLTTTEIEIQAKLSHSNLIQIISVQDFDSHVVIEMELMEGGSLKDLILSRFKREGDVLFKEKEISLILSQMYQGINYLHEQNVIHRDIKPGAVLNRKPYVC